MASFGARKIALKFMKDSYTTTNLIRGFFPIELAARFQELQWRTSAVVSGSVGLGFFFQLIFKGADIDIFVHAKHREEVTDFILDAGYQEGRLLATVNEMSAFLPTEVSFFFWSGSYTAKSISAVYEFTHKYDTSIKVQVILCLESPIDVLLGFHSTAPMNLVTHDMAISLYPKAMFDLGINYAKHDERGPAVRGREKYTVRGWVPVTDSTGDANGDLRNVEWYIGDRHCWIIHLPPLSPFLESDYMVIGHSWVLTYPNPDAGWITFYGLLSLPEISTPLCTSHTVVENWADTMADWSSDRFATFVKDLLGELPSDY